MTSSITARNGTCKPQLISRVVTVALERQPVRHFESNWDATSTGVEMQTSTSEIILFCRINFCADTGDRDLPKQDGPGYYIQPRNDGRRYEAVLRLSEALSVCTEPSEDLTKILSEQLREFLELPQFYIIVYKEKSSEVEWAVVGLEKALMAAYADVPVEQPTIVAGIYPRRYHSTFMTGAAMQRCRERLKQGIAAHGLDVGPLVFVPLTTPHRRLGPRWACPDRLERSTATMTLAFCGSPTPRRIREVWKGLKHKWQVFNRVSMSSRTHSSPELHPTTRRTRSSKRCIERQPSSRRRESNSKHSRSATVLRASPYLIRTTSRCLQRPPESRTAGYQLFPGTLVTLLQYGAGGSTSNQFRSPSLGSADRRAHC